MLIKKNHPVSPIKSIMLLISISLFFVFSLAPSKLYAVLNSPDVTHSAANYVECAGGRVGPACPSGQEYIAPGLIFSENFDSQPDWATTGRQTLPAELPDGWDFARTDEEWHPADGDTGTQPSMMITGSDPSQVHGGTGKAFITYSESFDAQDDNGWTSDGFIGIDFEPQEELYAKFDIKFQPGFAPGNTGGQIKIFRVLSWDGPNSGTGERNKFFSDGNSAPIYIWDWAQSDQYGLRHFHAFRCDDQGTNYYCNSPSILNPPRQVITGDMSANYTDNATATDPQIPDLINGGFIARSGTTWHDNVWGDAWHTVEIHLKQNSAPGVQDGVLQWWLDGEKVVSMNQVAWIGTNGSMDAKWNSLSIGGNDAFHFDLVGAPADRERWYAIDNILVMPALPEGLN